MSQIREDIHRGKTNDARNEIINTIVEKIAETTEIDIPEVMIDEELEHQLSHRKEDLQRQGINWDQMLAMSNMTEDDVKADTRPEAERRLRNTMILQEIARIEEIQVNDEDLDAEVDRVAGPDLNPDENDEEAVARAKRLRDVYNSDYFRNVLRNDLFERKLTDRIIEIATEGKGAAINAYVAPEPEETTATSDSTEEAPEAKPATRSSKLPTEGEGSEWVAGNGSDTAPEGFPIKGNATSKIFHPEESPNYASMAADIHFSTAEAAEAHGYRLPKTLQTASEE
jgi:trigger factor